MILLYTHNIFTNFKLSYGLPHKNELLACSLRFSFLFLDYSCICCRYIVLVISINCIFVCKTKFVYRTFYITYLRRLNNYNLFTSATISSFHKGTGKGRGTPPWIAPEVYKQHRFSTASDIYNLGVLIFEIYTQDTLDPEMVQFIVPASFPDYVKTLLPKCCEIDYKERCSIKDVIATLPTGLFLFCFVLVLASCLQLLEVEFCGNLQI